MVYFAKYDSLFPANLYSDELVLLQPVEYNSYFAGACISWRRDANGGAWQPHYRITDHLGSTRLETKSNGTITAAYDYKPFGEQIPLMTSKTRKTYIGKERDDESYLGDFGVRKYDYAAGRFTSPDVLWEKYMGWSPYSYSGNNPIYASDASGLSIFHLGLANGVGDYVIDDGSNASYSIKGKKELKHFELTGFDESLGGKDEANLETAIQEAQNLNMQNKYLEPHLDKNGVLETHCNFGTQDVLATVASVAMAGVYIDGNANTMNKKLKDMKIFQQVDKKTALENAENGGLSIYSLQHSEHGHIGTFSVGLNISKGEAANIGKHNKFGPLDKRNYDYFIFKP